MSVESPLNRRRRVLLRCLAIGLVGYAAGSVLLAELLLRPPRRTPTMAPEFRVHASREEIRSGDGTSLSMWVMEPEGGGSRGTVLFFHGMAAAHSPNHLVFLREAGYRGVSIDFRAHGESGGRRTGFGYTERLDVAAAIDYVREQWPDEKVGVWGASMGAAALCYAAESVRDVEAVILESCYSTIDEAFDNMLATVAPRWLLFLGEGPRRVIQWRTGLDGDLLRPIDRIDRLRPETVLLMTGDRDRRATPAEMRRLAARVPGAQTWLIPGASHYDTWRAGGRAYLERALQFLRARLG